MRIASGIDSGARGARPMNPRPVAWITVPSERTKAGTVPASLCGAGAAVGVGAAIAAGAAVSGVWVMTPG